MRTMSTPAASAPPSVIILDRLARTLAATAFLAGVGLVSGLFLLTLFPASQRLFKVVFTGQLPVLDLGIPVVLLFVVLTPVGVGLAARRLPRDRRGAVYLALVIAATLVANLCAVAWFPSLRKGLDGLFEAQGITLSWRMVLLGVLTFVIASYAAWRLLRPLSWRGAGLFVVALAALFTADVIMIAHVPALLEDAVWLTSPAFGGSYIRDQETLIDLMVVAGLCGITPVLMFGIAWWRRWNSWRWIGGGWLVLAPVLAYLAADDSVLRRPLTMEEIAPAFPGAEPSHAVLMRYGNKQPAARSFKTPDKIYPNVPAESMDPGKPVEYTAWLLAHRRDLEAAWADFAPVRAWWHELNSFERIGDLTPPTLDAEIMSFGPPRLMTHLGCAIASLQAIDGRRDEAIETLLPVLQVARKLQPSARTLVRAMIAIVVEKSAIATANFILDRGPISPAARARLVAALTASGGGVAGARRLVAIEYAFFLNVSIDKRLGDLIPLGETPGLRPALNALSPFVFNRRATFNLYGDYVATAQELMANRQLEQLDPENSPFLRHEGRVRFKNFAGALLIREVQPTHGKVGLSYWATQDRRAELLARLNQL